MLHRFLIYGLLAGLLTVGSSVARADEFDPLVPGGKPLGPVGTPSVPDLKPIVPGGTPGVGSPRTGPVTLEQAYALYNALAALPDVAYRCVEDGCASRAHLMAQYLRALGQNPGKAWAMARHVDLGSLFVRTPLGSVAINGVRGQKWRYHVAVTLLVRLRDGSIDVCVLDPSLYSWPVLLRDWKNTFYTTDGSKPHFTETRFGQAPTDPDGNVLPGTGYWPGEDPFNPDEHARFVMRKYKPYEGRRLPSDYPSKVHEEYRDLVRSGVIPAGTGIATGNSVPRQSALAPFAPVNPIRIQGSRPWDEPAPPTSSGVVDSGLPATPWRR